MPIVPDATYFVSGIINQRMKAGEYCGGFSVNVNSPVDFACKNVESGGPMAGAMSVGDITVSASIGTDACTPPRRQLT